MSRTATTFIAVLALAAIPASAGASQNRDRNHDGLPDSWENRHHLSLHSNQSGRDQDHDGLSNRQEFKRGTNPRKADSDRDGLKDGYKALTARPFLPRYFPGFDLYFWIDADCWVQQGDAISLFLAAARTGALAVAPEIHRSMRHYHHAWGEFSAVCGAAYEACFDKATAERLIRYPMINAGVFALQADASHWAGWTKVYGEALQRSTDLTDQLALNVLVYDKGFRHEPLPSRCNWPVHHATPAWDAEHGLFVEPAIPYEPLGILHMTIYTKRLAALDVRELGGPHAGQVRARSLRWPGRALREP